MGYHDRKNDGSGWPDAAAPGTPRWLPAVIGVAVGICLVVACGAGAYFWVLPALAPATLPAPPVVPTAPGDDVSGTEEPESTSMASPAPAATPVETARPPTGAIVAPRAASTPRIDGALDEWPESPQATSNFPVYNSAAWEGEGDLLATWWLAWDETNLYVAVRVTDDLHVQTEQGSQIYRGDSVEIQIDTNPAAGAVQVNPETFQLILSPGDFGGGAPAAAFFHGASDGSLPYVQQHGIVLASRQTGQGYLLEAVIPWTDLNVAPQIGVVLGVALNVNDNDTPATAAQELMLSHVPGRTLRDPSTWGAVALQ